ncbi:SMI1/KNR4 family protein [Tuwongella immobilis]|uniref:Knr4/Smi1-like domain-containing protein n=1 Tax=Tuwongella immobilis TaxID=692036 RepID=A0A6C2YSY1_9BACT|nr:SMI1/KNR4 family protein [Tuwongella immobilis]VIP04566.1 Uncharacterized protein OS=Blastopirellula marina DSM 3645 GN=DSM3645_27563 PE=4 SV=1: SUKH_6 [Tuwongella immobilis]VTS06493.1 Uncharacterized protein OS=Blastopirellula marina DSM 3645 GN=DSM3645_27563 PE=4 SV=1: SUKH_6 [Tuwongella immobilis]
MDQELISKMESAGQRFDFYGPQSLESIEQLEMLLDVRLPPSYREFLHTLGGGGYSLEGGFCGIFDNDPSLIEGGTTYGETVIAREEIGLPHHLIVILHDSDLMIYWCLDFSRQRPDSECPVVGFDSETRATTGDVGATFRDVLLNYLSGTER